MSCPPRLSQFSTIQRMLLFLFNVFTKADGFDGARNKFIVYFGVNSGESSYLNFMKAHGFEESQSAYFKAIAYLKASAYFKASAYLKVAQTFTKKLMLSTKNWFF